MNTNPTLYGNLLNLIKHTPVVTGAEVNKLLIKDKALPDDIIIEIPRNDVLYKHYNGKKGERALLRLEYDNELNLYVITKEINLVSGDIISSDTAMFGRSTSILDKECIVLGVWYFEDHVSEEYDFIILQAIDDVLDKYNVP